jgi:hypothetical protein
MTGSLRALGYAEPTFGDHGRCMKKGFVLGFVVGWIAAFALWSIY